jgi:nitrite reductase/ring-hydroxylating ferredoxin subunit
MPQVRIAALSQLPPGTVQQAEVGEDTYAVCNAGGEIHVLEGICPHAGGPLGQGALHGATLVCPWHAWEYDCRTGACDGSDDLRLAKFPVILRDGEVWIEVP